MKVQSLGVGMIAAACVAAAVIFGSQAFVNHRASEVDELRVTSTICLGRSRAIMGSKMRLVHWEGSNSNQETLQFKHLLLSCMKEGWNTPEHKMIVEDMLFDSPTVARIKISE